MKWYVLVFFLSWQLDGTRDTFVFTNPVYDSEAECRATLLNRYHIEKYVDGLMKSYNGMLPGAVEKVNCIDQNAYDALVKLKKLQFYS